MNATPSFRHMGSLDTREFHESLNTGSTQPYRLQSMPIPIASTFAVVDEGPLWARLGGPNLCINQQHHSRGTHGTELPLLP